MARARVAVLCLALLALGGCKEVLYSGLSEREANQIIAALMEIGIPASKRAEAEGISIEVQEGRFPEAINLLNARGLPNASYESFGDVFEREGIVSSPMEERARYVYALSQELSETIAEIDGVLSARVHVVLPETDMLGRDFQPSSASVFIRHAATTSVSGFTSQIKELVANSIEGLDYDNVAVVSVPAAPQEAAAAEGPVLEDVMGVWVHPASVTRLWTMLGTAGGAVLLVLGVATALLLGGRRAPRTADTGFDEA